MEIIEDGCFCNCDSLKEIIIPDTVTDIGTSAFRNCKSLEKITLPKNLTVLSVSMFVGCTSLKSVSLPNNISMLCDSAFCGTTKLDSIELPEKFNSISGPPFAGSSIKTLIFNYDVDIFYSTYDFGLDYDFIYNSNINKLVIGNNVKKINENLFNISGSQITEIEYHGSKKQFEEFKETNKKLFAKLTNISKVSCTKKSLVIEKDMYR